jgi:hypothetical protein
MSANVQSIADHQKQGTVQNQDERQDEKHDLAQMPDQKQAKTTE